MRASNDVQSVVTGSDTDTGSDSYLFWYTQLMLVHVHTQ